MWTKKTGVLVVNLGTPDEPTRSAVYRYLKEFLLDKRVIDIGFVQRNLLVRGIIAPFRSGNSAKGYQKLWTHEGSPLKVYGYAVERKLQQKLGDKYVVKLAMRYQSPAIRTVLAEMVAENVTDFVIFPMFPQYASASTGSVFEEVMDFFREKEVIPDIRFINNYATDEGLAALFSANAAKFDLDLYDHVLFSFHGLPIRQLVKADTNRVCQQASTCCETLTEKNQFCYSAQCYSTAQAIARKMALPKEKYTVCFQSRLGNDPWTNPFTVKVLEELAAKGTQRILIFCPAFTADCLETIIEIGEEYRELFLHAGGKQLDFVESLNDGDAWIDFIAEKVGK